MSKAACLVLAAVLTAPVAAMAAPGWAPYADPVTGLRVDIPRHVFPQQSGVSEGGRGDKFVTADGSASLTVQTLSNEQGATPAAFLAAKNPPPGIVYRRVTNRYFVVSSFRNAIIFYNRCNFIDRVAHCVFVNYPARDKKRWDGIVTRISLSLR